MKEMLLAIHTKVSPPVDSDKKQDFYQRLCEEYCSQNHHKSVNAENVMFMISSTFFVLSDKKNNVKKGGISLEQYLDYVEKYGDDFITITQAKQYFKEIHQGKFLENYVKIMVSVDGMYKHMNNVNFLRNVYKMFPKSTPGDPFFFKRCLVFKLQFHQSQIKEKEIMLSEDQTKFLWYNKGTVGARCLETSKIIDVETGFTEAFLKYLEHPKFSNLIQDEKLCLSIITEKRSYDFYGKFA